MIWLLRCSYHNHQLKKYLIKVKKESIIWFDRVDFKSIFGLIRVCLLRVYWYWLDFYDSDQWNLFSCIVITLL